VNYLGITTNTKVNSTFYPCGVGKASTGRGYGGRIYLCQIASNIV